MTSLLRWARWIDALNRAIGWLAMWLILAATLISAGNAIVRRALGTSSNAWLEVQWYLFAAVFMLGGGYAFLRNAHVRIDFVSSRLSARTRNWIDIVGIVVFILPLCALMIKLGWPLFERAWASGEMSSNAGGLIRWPVYLLIPAGFALLALQSFSELIKRVAFLTGHGPDPLEHEGPSETQRLAKDIAAAEAARQSQSSLTSKP
ncbi:Tripartite ATP-independent periplasmic transporter, DctQ component [Tepidimonas alkaliphilus]|uniref:TRAP transporter small permease protein n=1 Tax=Tepidimonas alkaliphilus TaxID=2588942 RepID=A0A554WD56_9BURK|nr:TRAP transporter small permease subunit [Tepidimonas alkaliphilus]TSE21496.1 Tripartite ATP-independent periplasmic transporter, DctQ component [Tepidimonas alkaliphilus]